MRYLLVGLLLLAGCSPTQVPTDSPSAVAPSGVTTTPTPEPTPTCSPIGGTPSPCSADEYAKVEAQNKAQNDALANSIAGKELKVRLTNASEVGDAVAKAAPPTPGSTPRP